MTDEEMYELLNDFAQQHALAVGLQVEVSFGCLSFKTVDFKEGGKYEYSHMLSDMIRGAEQFLMWVRREGKDKVVIKVSKPSKSVGLSTRKGIKQSKSDSKKRK